MSNPRSERSPESPQSAPPLWTKPSFELIPLDCEITAYAPDGDLPLF
jgi:coenzyme PQQ precursor peptide PqqA